MKLRALFLLLLPLFQAFSQMVDPAIDHSDEPFSYFSKPTDVLGVMDSRMGTLLSPEGFLCTPFAELLFFTGDPPEPIDQRVKTLRNGYLPVIQEEFTRRGVRYRIEAFAATLDGRPESTLMNFIRVRIRNLAHQDRRPVFTIATRYEGEVNTAGPTPDHRYARPAVAKRIGNYEQLGLAFNPDWEYELRGDAFLRDGKVMVIFPEEPPPARSLTLEMGYNRPNRLTKGKLRILPTTPVGILGYAIHLLPGEERTLDFKMPFIPLSPENPELAGLREATYDEYLQRTSKFWEEMIGRGAEIIVPEEKVVNTFKASLVYDLIARNRIDSFYVQKVNDFQYHSFWLRDASYIVCAYDLTGYHDIARQCLDFFLQWQQGDGNFLSQGGQFDGWGQTLWAFGKHYRMTGDQAFAEKVYPAVVRAIEWLKRARRSDPLGLMPATTPGDNEDITGHVTGHNFWALAGMRNAIAVAEGLGKSSDAEAFRAEERDYREALKRRLEWITKISGGAIPPGLDSLGGQDWGNLLAVYPEEILDPHDAMVTATLKASRAKYQEGLMTYADGMWLHHYLTMKNTESEVIRGEQETALQEFYALLVHTSSTHAGFETSIIPWGTRDFGLNLAPHGWFASKFRALLRNMMVREEGSDIHLFSVLSPAWVRTGEKVAARRVPTLFGTLSAVLECHQGGATLRLETKWKSPPKHLVLHLPDFMRAEAITADGIPLRARAGALTLSPETKRVEIRWAKKEGMKGYSYTQAVRQWKAEYRKRYAHFIRKG